MHQTCRPNRPALPRRASGLAAALAVLLPLAACVTRTTETTPGAAPAAADSATTPGTAVTLHQEGGIAGIVVDATVDGAARTYRTVTRRFCAPDGRSCPPPIDSASGPLSDSLATAVAAAVDAADFFALRPDYGTDPRLRDGFVYVVTARRGARTASVRGDDMTRPQALATLTSEVTRVIQVARGM